MLVQNDLGEGGLSIPDRGRRVSPGTGMKEWKGEERRSNVFSDEQIKTVADKVAEKALDIIYAQIGRSTIKLVLRVIGVGCVAVIAWLGATGKLK
jgi:hypothetical protein